MMKQVERWVDMLGFDGFYSISTSGRIRSEPRISAAGRRLAGKILKDDKGKVKLWGKDGGGSYESIIHAMVDNFIGWPNDKDLFLRYVDGNTNNRSLGNLTFCRKTGKTNHQRIIDLLKSKYPDVYLDLKEEASIMTNGSKNGHNGSTNRLTFGSRGENKDTD